MRTDGRVARPRPMGGLDRLCEHGSRATRQLGLYSAEAERIEYPEPQLETLAMPMLVVEQGMAELPCATTLVPWGVTLACCGW